MAIDNTSIGSVLTIPDGLLKNLEKVDERLDSIKKKQQKLKQLKRPLKLRFINISKRIFAVKMLTLLFS